MNDTTLSPAILGQQVDLLYRNVRLGQIISVINASLLVWIARGAIEPLALYAWGAAACLVAVLRAAQASAYQRLDDDRRHAAAAHWRQRALWGAAASGLIWSSGAWLLIWNSATTLQLFTGFVMAGMVAGAVPVLAAERTVFRAYAWPIILTVCVAGLGSDPLHIAFSLMSLLFLLAVTRSADNFHDTLHDTFRLEHEKDGLVADLQQAKRLAESSDRAKTEFLANISHELRTPMNGILGLAELLDLEALTDEQRELLTPLRQSADQLLLLINHLIQLSALEAGHIKLAPSLFASADLHEHLQASYAPAAAAKGLQLQEDFAAELPPLLIGDVSQLRQVFEHLVGNAIKFTERGSVVIAARPVTADQTSVTVEFTVSDSGPGMTADKLALLGSGGLFVQADGSIVRRHGGTGIGLPIARKLIELLGGSLRIDSEVGVGSRFSFTLPFALPDRAAPV